jgi:transcriptional regulator with XRE-family HTH domain
MSSGPSLRSRFGTRLRGIRLEANLSQEELAEMLSISVEFLSLIERGKSAPSFETLERIGKRLRIPVWQLFQFDDPPQSPRERVRRSN